MPLNDNGKNLKLINKHFIPKTSGDITIFCSEETTDLSIDRNEMNIIRNIIETIYTIYNGNVKETLSELVSKEIKKKLGGEWFVIVHSQKQKLYYNISTVSNTNIIKLKIGESKFQIAKIK